MDPFSNVIVIPSAVFNESFTPVSWNLRAGVGTEKIFIHNVLIIFLY